MPTFNFPKHQRSLIKVPLHWVLVVPFVLQTVGAVGLVGYFSYQSGQKAVEDLAHALLAQVSERVSDRLDRYLQTPQDIVAINRLAVKQGTLNIKDFEQLRRHFWQQMSLKPLLSSNEFWSQQGEVITYGRIFSEEERDYASKLAGKNLTLGKTYISKVNKINPRQRQFYLVDSNGKPEKLVYSIVDVDFRQLPWYNQAKDARKQTWSSISVSRVVPVLQIQAFAPIYNAGKFEGVFNSIYLLSEISDFLHKQNFSPSGQVFIIERSGNLVASSSLEKPYITQANGEPKRLLAINSQDTRTKEVAQKLIKRFGSFQKLQDTKQLNLVTNNQHQFVQITPYRDNYGLDWLIVVVVPESDFMGSINLNVWRTILLCGLAFLSTTVASILSAYYIAKPIRRLSRASQALAAGNWQNLEQGDCAIKEISVLAQSFNSTAEQLQQSFERIKTALQESEAKFTKVFRTSPDPMSINQLGDGGKYLEVNDSFVKFSEYSREETIGRTPEELNLSANLQQDAILWELLQKHGRIEGFEFHYRTKSGKLGTTLLSIELVELDGQQRVLSISKDITDRKQLELALQASQDKLNDILNSAIAAITSFRVFVHGNWEINYISAGCEFISGYTPTELQADKNLWTSRIFAGNWEALKSQVFADIFAQRKGTYQYRFYHKDGSLRWISQTNTSRWDETLNCWIVTAVSLDISNQKQAEEQLYKTEQWLNQFSHSSPSVIYTLVQEPDGFLWYEYISSASETINEVTAEQALKDASAVIGLMHPEEIPGYIAAVTHSAETLELFCHQWRIITPSGKLKWLQATSQPERRSNGAIAWYGVVLDITEQKQTEQALQQALQHIDTHFDKSPLAILEWDKDFRILRWSKQAERIFGWTAEEVKNLSWQPLAGRGAGETRRQAVEVETEQISASCSSESPICCKFVHEEDLERVNAEMCPLMNGLASRKAVQNRNYTKDGRVIVCQWYSSAVFDDTGNLVSVLSFAQDITDRKRAELELKQQKELRETIFNESTDAIFLVDPQTLLITDCNRRAVELFEVESKAELIGIEGRTLQRRPFTEAEINEISQTVQQKGFWSTELEYISHKGNLFWGNLAAKPVQIANKTIRLVRVTDISDRKKIEAALLESEQTNRALIQSLPDLLIRMSRDGTYLDVRTTEGVKLINPEKMKQGANIFEVLPSEIAQERSNYMQIALATGEVQIQEYQFEIEGTIHYEEARIVPCGSNEVLIIVRDMTDRKTIEAALRESEERFRRAFDDAAIGMALVTLDGKFLQVNLALCEITGYNEAELVGSFFQDITHPEDLNADLEYIRQALAGECRSYQMEMRYIHKSGHLVWGLLGVSVVKDQGGNSLYFVAQIQDISERHKIDRIKDEFISIISHELRTPLTAIRGSLGILETGVLDNRPEKAKYMLQLAVNNSDRLVRLVNDILDLERLQSGKVELVMEMCQIEDLMQQSVESVQVIANQADVKLELIPLVAEVWASPDAIVQALTNLLSNAIKFSPANSTIWLSAELRNSEPGTEENQTVSHSPLSSSYILFQVKDQGRGIPADKLEAIFGRFQQVDISDARQKGGTGLGLAICKSIVQQHGGKIWAQSTLGEGSVFYFTLPITSREV